MFFFQISTTLADCSDGTNYTQSRVRTVIDGDTVELMDRQHVRLIGINAPELHDTDGNSQPFSHESRALLQKILKIGNNRISLQLDREHRDKYGRLLAHAFTPAKKNISELMIRGGLAARITVTPNNWMADCYQLAEDHARSRKTGIWQQADFWLKKNRRLTDDSSGFFIVQDKVMSVDQSRKSIWINLYSGIALRIARSDLHRFNRIDIDTLEGENIEARGWVTRYKNTHRLRVREEINLKLLD